MFQSVWGDGLVSGRRWGSCVWKDVTNLNWQRGSQNEALGRALGPQLLPGRDPCPWPEQVTWPRQMSGSGSVFAQQNYDTSSARYFRKGRVSGLGEQVDRREGGGRVQL